ncbi:MAG TPA: LssY C-terminal domain-containing protein [Bryobacteraceae bacterium]|nr:LssY C-terminal domain-containing protein [Bryobacteraceae bacterium]
MGWPLHVLMKGMGIQALVCTAAIALAPAMASAVTIPAGTIIQIRLTSAVSSQKPSGQPFTAVLTVPLFMNGAAIIAPGAELSGKTSDVKAVSKPDEAATLRLVFATIKPKGGQLQSIAAEVSSVDNARESVGADGLITGIVASQTWYGRLNQGIGKMSSNHPGLADLLGSVRDSMLKEVDASITYAPGVDLEAKLTKALDWKQPAINYSVAPIEPAAELATLVGAEPNRTTAASPPSPSDLTNFMFIGTAAQLEAAFKAAGWSAAAERNDTSTMETARAIIEDRGYKEAPVSLLTLDGKAPDYVFQKQNDTFAMRHHIRIWRRPQTFNGAIVWMGAGTHDIGIDFSEQSRSFTHKIDSNIDRERSKVVNDLLFAQAVKALALVDRPNIPQNVTNATGDKLITDGKIAVLELRSL